MDDLKLAARQVSGTGVGGVHLVSGKGQQSDTEEAD